MKKISKFLSLLLMLVLCAALLSVPAFADGEGYSFSNGKLTISDSAAIETWRSDSTFSASDVTSLVIGGNVSNIQGDILNDLKNLESVVFEGEITLSSTISNDAQKTPFKEMPALKTVTFEANANVGDGFSQCPELKKVEFKGTSVLSNNAFKNCPKIATVTFTEETTVAGSAFNASPENPNTALTKLVFPAESKIFGQAFSYFEDLESVTFEGDVTLEHGQFQNCTNLKTIKFNGESTIGGGAFYICPNIAELNFAKKTTVGGSAFNVNASSPNKSLETLVFPAGSTVRAAAFSNYEGLKSITFEGDVQMREGQFNNCKNLRTINFNGESTIGGGAFYHCPNIAKLNFAKKTAVGDSAFNVNASNPNKSLETLVFPADSTVHAGAFSYYDDLKSITFEGNVQMREGQFNNCKNLKTVNFNGESTIGGGVFKNCPNIAELNFAKAATLTDSAFEEDPVPNEALKTLVLPEGSQIDNALFANYKALESITFKGSVNLNARQFQNCEKLETIKFMAESTVDGNSFGNCPNISNLTFEKPVTLKGSSFMVSKDIPNKKLKTLVLPEGSKVNYSLFSHYEALESVTFEGDIELTAGQFSNCPSIAKVSFGGTATVGGSAFACEEDTPNTKLKDLVLPSGSILRDGAFTRYTALQKVTLKSGAQLGSRVLRDCSALKEFEFESEDPYEFARFTFTKFNPSDIVICVPQQSCEKYAEELKKDTGSDATEHHNVEYVDCLVKAEPSTPGGSSSRGGGSGSSTLAYSVTTPAKTQGGSVAVDKYSYKQGDTVTLTVKPDQGYVLETLTVTDAKGENVKLTEKDGKYTFKMPASKVTINATFMDDNTMLNYFVDVNANDYFYDAVLWAVEKGVTSGVDDLHFAPDASCTRAQAVTFLYRADGSPEIDASSEFSDVAADAYYAKAVAWAKANGITDGTGDGKFSPDAICTRAQIVSFLYRYNNMDTLNNDNNPFIDVHTDDYFYNAVLWASEQGVTAGTSATTFGPNADCTRAQIVTFLYRYMGL